MITKIPLKLTLRQLNSLWFHKMRQVYDTVHNIGCTFRIRSFKVFLPRASYARKDVIIVILYGLLYSVDKLGYNIQFFLT